MSDCIETTATIDHYGYGVINKTISPGVYRVFKAHRLAYEEAYGPIPEGMSILHMCDNRKCINPEHLVAGTRAQNQADMQAKGRARNAHMGKTHCKWGHPFDEANTYYYLDGRGRQCKQCWKDRAAKRKAKKSGTL